MSNVNLTSPYPRSIYLCYAFGYLTPFETMYLMSLSRSLPPNSTIVNIGAGAGTSGLAFAEAHIALDQGPWHVPPTSAQIYTIDIRQESPEGGLTNETNAFKAVGWERHTPSHILGDSKETGAKWAYGMVDLVFIDGDHSSTGCAGDIQNWVNHLKPGGLMVFHDYGGPYWGDVKKVVDELMKEWIALPVVDRVAAFRKPFQTGEKYE